MIKPWSIENTYLVGSKVGPVPGTKECHAVRAETSLVNERRREAVPADERTAVDTRYLVEGQDVTLVLCQEPLHTEQVKVPLVAVAGQVADLKTGRSSASAIALSIGSVTSAADSFDGDGVPGLAFLELSLNLLKMALNQSRVDMRVLGAVLESNGELKDRQECEEHAHHARGLAEVCHCGQVMMLFWIRRCKRLERPKARTRDRFPEAKNGAV